MSFGQLISWHDRANDGQLIFPDKLQIAEHGRNDEQPIAQTRKMVHSYQDLVWVTHASGHFTATLSERPAFACQKRPR